MGKIIIEFLLPAIILLGLSLYCVRFYFLNFMQRNIDNVKKVRKAAKKYDGQLHESVPPSSERK